MIFFDGNMNEITMEECIKSDPCQVINSLLSKLERYEKALRVAADPDEKEFNKMLAAVKALEE